jgi:hypothetical protein
MTRLQPLNPQRPDSSGCLELNEVYILQKPRRLNYWEPKMQENAAEQLRCFVWLGDNLVIRCVYPREAELAGQPAAQPQPHLNTVVRRSGNPALE